MKYTTVLLAALSGAAIAGPVQKRQDIDFDAYNAVPQLDPVAAPAGDPVPVVPTYVVPDVASAAAAAATDASDPSIGSGASAVIDTASSGSASNLVTLRKRAACDARTAGTGPAFSGSATDFQQYSVFSDAANTAAPVDGYVRVVTNSNGAAEHPSYLTYTMLSSYNPGACAAYCQAQAGCNSFNIYFERDAIMEPGAGCSNPAPTTYVKCAIFGALLDLSSATNKGQWQADFHVVVAGSNIYTVAAPGLASGYQSPVYLANATIQSPLASYLGVQTFPANVSYAPDAICAAACDATSQYVAKHGGKACNFFVSYYLYKDNVNGVWTCTYYNSAWDPSYATNKGQYDQQGHHYTIGKAWSYSRVGAPVNQLPSSSTTTAKST